MQAKNDSIVRAVDNFFDYVRDVVAPSKEGLDQPLYFAHTVMKQQRVHISTQLINPQANKFHRGMLTRDSWETKVNTSNAKQMNSFKLRVLEGLGVKTEKALNADSLKSFDAVFDPDKVTIADADAAAKAKKRATVLSTAVDALVASLNGETLSPEQQRAVADGVAAGGEKMHSLDALMAMAQWRRAEAEAGKGETFTFTTNITGEIDGVTNGPMLSHILFGAAESWEQLFSVINRGGFFQVGSLAKHYSAWRSAAGNEDLYESTIGKALNSVLPSLIESSKFPDLAKKQVAAIYAFTGDLVDSSGKIAKAGRNIIKTPLTAFIFGSSPFKAADSMADEFVGTIYKKFEEAGRKGESISPLIQQLNQLLKKDLILSEGMPYSKFKDYKFSPAQVDSIKSAFGFTVGAAVKSTFEENFGALITRRNAMNAASNLAFHLYDAAYQGIRAKYLADLVANKKIPASAGKIAYHDLSKEQEAKLDELMKTAVPQLHTVMSKQDGDLSTGLTPGKQKSKLTEDTTYSGQIISLDPVTGKPVGAEVRGNKRVSVEPGAAMPPASAHSTDSGISHEAADNGDVLNVHDAHIVGLDGFYSAGEALNTATFNNLLAYSPLTETYDMLARTVAAIDTLMKNRSLPKETKENFAKAMEQPLHGLRLSEDPDYAKVYYNSLDHAKKGLKLSKKAAQKFAFDLANEAGSPITIDDYVQRTLFNIKYQAYQGDVVRLGALAHMTVVDQYAAEGAAYTVTPENRAAAEAELARVEKAGFQLPDVLKKQASKLVELFTSTTNSADTPVISAESAEKSDMRDDDGDLAYDPPDWWQETKSIEDSDAATILKALIQEGQTEQIRIAATEALQLLLSKQVESFDAALKMLTDKAASADLRGIVLRAQWEVRGPVWASLGNPKIAPQQWIVDLFSKQSEVPAAQFMAKMAEHLKGLDPTPYVRSQQAILNQLRSSVPAGVVMKYITAKTNWGELVNFPANSAHGWFTPEIAGGEIAVLSGEFENSRLTGELLMHELIHAASFAAIDASQQAPGKNPQVDALVKELEDLRQAVQEMVESNPNLDKFSPALQDIHELVAYGLTNQSFQREVLAKVNVQRNESKAKKNILVNGMRAFIDMITGLLYKNATAKMTVAERENAGNGLAILIDNASGIFAQMAKAPTISDQKIRRSLSMAAPDPVRAVNKYSTRQIFEALDDRTGPNQLSPGFKEHLGELLTDITGLLHGPFGLDKLAAMRDQALTPMDVWQKALDTGEAPFASKVAGAPFRTSAQELFVIEQMEVAVRAVLDNKEAHVSVAYNELSKLYQEARSKLKPSDFQSQEQYDFLFKVEQGKGSKSDYLSRFVAMGLAHKDFHVVLNTVQAREVATRVDMTWTDRLQEVFNKVLQWLNDKMTKAVPGQPAAVAMQNLVKQLVDIEAKKRTTLAMSNSAVSKFAVVEEKTLAFVEAVKFKAVELAQSSIVQQSKSGYVKGAAGLTRIVVNDQTEQIMTALQQLRDRHLKQHQGWVTGLLNEVRGVPATIQGLIRMAKKNEQDRKRHMDDVALAVRSAFKNAAERMDPESQAAITQVFLRTGMHVLTQTRDLKEIQKLLEDPKALDQAIKDQIANLNEHPKFVHYFVNQAKALGHHKVTGEVKSRLLMMNAGNIARLYGTGVVSPLSEVQAAEVEQAVDQLATLYALKYTDKKELTAANEVLRTEMNRQDGGNGVEQVLKLHARLEADSRKRLFAGTEAMMIKGFTPDIVNPHTSIATARTGSEQETLLDMGYSEAGEMSLDPNDPDRTVGRLYVLKDGGLMGRVTGAVSATGMSAKGSKVDGAKGNVFASEALGNAQVAAQITLDRQAEIQRLFQAQPGWDPRSVNSNFMAPVMNAKGEVSNWRYLMQDKTKNLLLQRDSRFDQVLGALAGSIVDKKTTADQNAEVLQALKDIHTADYARRPESFVRIAADSSDPEMREIYRLLPDATQREIKEIWGNSPLQVPYELIHPVFGYRKWSLSSSFDKKDRNRRADREGVDRNAADQLNDVEELFTKAVEGLLYGIGLAKGMSKEQAERYSRRGSVVVRRAENYWQAVVQLTKDIIVVKTMSVMISNIKENVAMLVLQGVPLKSLARDHFVAIRGALDYNRDRKELAQIQIKLNSGYTRGDEDELRAQAAILEDAIARNPVSELIEAGMMPTIAEDLDAGEDIYSYKAKFQRKVESIADKLNPNVLEVGKFVFMTHDTPLYKGLSHINNLSDFVGRYVLHKHLTTRQENPLSNEDAIQKASDVFVNYDIPMHPGMQYLDDHGFMMFTKYFLRIQKVLLRLTREQPMRVLMGTLLKHHLDALPMPTSSSMLYKLGNNPLTTGAARFPGTVDDLVTVEAMKLLF